MSDMVGSALLRRMIGREFRELREQAGLTLDQVAAELDRGRATIGRIEEGHESVRFRAGDVRETLDLYGVTGEQRDRLLGLTAEIRSNQRKKAFHDYEFELPDWMRLFYVLEQGAEIIRRYEPELVPGLLQTQAYAEQTMLVGPLTLTPEQVQERVQFRMERQTILTKPRAARHEYMLNEAVLRRPAGSSEIMAEQLGHLLELTKRGNISIRVVPFAAGLHAAMEAGTFTLMDFPDKLKEPPTSYVSSTGGGMYLYAEAVARYRANWADLEARALDEKGTRAFLQDAREGWAK